MLENRPERRNTGAILLQLTTSYKVEGANMLHPSDELRHPDIVMTPLRPFARLRALRTREQRPQVLCTRHVHGVKSGRSAKNMNQKNTKKSPIHENANANITCDFGDGDFSRLGVAYQTHVIHNYLDYIKIPKLDMVLHLPCTVYVTERELQGVH